MLDYHLRWNANGSIQYSWVFEGLILHRHLYIQHILIRFWFRYTQPHHGGNTVAFMIMVFYGFFGFALIYVVCELSQRISNAFSDICDAIDTYDWYLYPLELQRMLPLIILPIQQPVVIRCFGCVQCSRRAFKNVSRERDQLNACRKGTKIFFLFQFIGLSFHVPGIQIGIMVLRGIQNG